MLLGGELVGLLSGLVGSAGPLGAAIFLSLNLNPIAYIASEAVTATAMHVVKTMVYQKYIGIGLKEVIIESRGDGSECLVFAPILTPYIYKLKAEVLCFSFFPRYH